MNNLKIYKSMPEWNAGTLPEGFRRKHNTQHGTWAQLTVRAGALRFTHLTADDEVLSSHVVDVAAGPQLVEPGAWHRVEPLNNALRCQLSFLCEPHQYLEKKHGLTAPHSEVRTLLPEILASDGRTVLDLGSGRGRNSFFFVEHGFDVTAVDRSATSIDALRQLQAVEGFDLSSKVYDINRASLAEVLPAGEVDHIVSTVVFQFLEAARVPAILDDMRATTRCGGLHLVVAPVTSKEVPCPLSFPFVFQRGDLRRHYQDWEVLRYSETLGEFHKRDEHGERYKAEFATLVARKPGPRD